MRKSKETHGKDRGRKKRMKRKLLNLNLRMFEGEGAGGTAAQAAAGGNTGGSGSRAAAGMEVKYGIQEEPTTKVTSNTAEDREAAFEKMIKGEYKDQFTKRMQRVINERFAETKGLKEREAENKPIMDLLRQRYGVESTKDLLKAIEEDSGYYEQEAAEKGMTVEQLKEVKRLERENAELIRQQKERTQREEFDEFMGGCLEQAESMKEIYPTFDFDEEMNGNEEFSRLVFKGVDVKTAYEVTHMDEIMGGAMQYTAEQTRRATINNIRSRNSRPAEAGAAKQTGVTVKKDVHSLTAKDRAEIARRVSRGETIRF